MIHRTADVILYTYSPNQISVSKASNNKKFWELIGEIGDKWHLFKKLSLFLVKLVAYARIKWYTYYLVCMPTNSDVTNIFKNMLLDSLNRLGFAKIYRKTWKNERAKRKINERWIEKSKWESQSQSPYSGVGTRLKRLRKKYFDTKNPK